MGIGIDPGRAAWEIEPRDFAALDSLQERAKLLLRYAILAPSGHNTQPWKFRLDGDGVSVYLDRCKHLPVVDPECREAILSVGAAIMNLRVAASHLGCVYRVQYVPDGHTPDLLARITFPRDGYVDADLAQLFPAIVRRHTNRSAYEPRPIPFQLLQQLQRLCPGCSTAIRIVTDHELRVHMGELVAQADRLQFSSPAFRTELAAWIRSSRTRARDGVPADAFGVPDFISGAGPWFMRTFDLGTTFGKSDQKLASEAPALAIVCGENTVPSWLEAGEMLERLLLALTQDGLQYAFLNQPIEVPDLRLELRDLLATTLWPQLLLRFGYAEPVRRPTPRHELEDVLLS